MIRSRVYAARALGIGLTARCYPDLMIHMRGNSIRKLETKDCRFRHASGIGSGNVPVLARLIRSGFEAALCIIRQRLNDMPGLVGCKTQMDFHNDTFGNLIKRNASVVL